MAFDATRRCLEASKIVTSEVHKKVIQHERGAPIRLLALSESALVWLIQMRI
jgi:hypothetical protein